jgi:hypothetical protein
MFEDDLNSPAERSGTFDWKSRVFIPPETLMKYARLWPGFLGWFCLICLIIYSADYDPSCYLSFTIGESVITYVVISSNARYSPLLIPSCVLWSCRAGFIPLILYIQKTNTSGNLPGILKASLNRIPDLRWHLIQVPDGYNDITVAQVSRSLAAFLPFVRDNDFLMTTDVDIWPVNGSFWRSFALADPVQAFNYDCCGSFRHRNITFRHYPMHSLVMKAKLWKTMITMIYPGEWNSSNLFLPLSQMLQVEFNFDGHYAQKASWSWWLDELLISYGLFLLQRKGIKVSGVPLGRSGRINRKYGMKAVNHSREVLLAKLDAHVMCLHCSLRIAL